MPHHHQITTCSKSGGPVSKFCSCAHCTLSVCSVCGAYEGALTTDCPGESVHFDRQKEVYETNLDYKDSRGWHQGESMASRWPRFEKPADSIRDAHVPHFEGHDVPPGMMKIVGCSCGWRPPLGSGEAFAAHAAAAKTTDRFARAYTDWAEIDRVGDLKHELSQRAIAWVLADRVADDHSATFLHVGTEVDEYLRHPDARAKQLLQKLDYAEAGFHLADQRAQKCDEEFRQAARKLVAELERGPPTGSTTDGPKENAR